jgi:hypothetical protein
MVSATRQLQAVVTGTTNQAVLWSSSAEAIATVSATGLVTGRAVGVAVITAISQVDSRVGDAAVVIVFPAHTGLVITNIMRAGTNTPLMPNNVSGEIDVAAEFFVLSYPIRLEFLLDNVVLPSCTQTFQAAGSAKLEAAGAMVPVRCFINTAASNPTTGALVYPNGPHRVAVQIVSPSGSVQSSSAQDLIFNNP